MAGTSDGAGRDAHPHSDHGNPGSGADGTSPPRPPTNPEDRPNAAARTLRRLRPYYAGIGLVVAAATVVAVGMALTERPPRPHSVPGGPATRSQGFGPAPGDVELAAYSDCAHVLAGLRAHTAAQVTAYGLPGDNPGYETGLRAPGPVAAPGVSAGSAAGAAGAGSAATSAPAHSTTNDQEVGVDEPDLVKSDGARVVSVSGGMLRVVDAASRTLTGTLDLSMYAGADAAQLLVSGDRALVILGGLGGLGGPIPGPIRGPIPLPSVGAAVPRGATGSTVLLVDIGSTPRILGTLHTQAAYVDARLHDGVARLVVQSTPEIAFPNPWPFPGEKDRRAVNRAAVERAPLSAWLPTYRTTFDGRSQAHTVPCRAISHPRHYSGTAVITVYSLDLGGSLADPHPISLVADAAAVYASASSLYVAGNDGSRTDVHRFALRGSGAPHYLGTGSVPGALLNSYSMSEYGGSLRVVTTRDSTSVYVLDADTLRVQGALGGLGAGERLHAVRFLGPLGYVVTYESVDPLFVLDLHDPHHPQKAGALTVTGYSDYLHPVGDGRLLGVGESVDAQQRVTGLQVSLFDVRDPARPTRLARVVRDHTPSENPLDPHAFLYWPATGTAVVPIDSWDPGQSGAVLVLHVDGPRLQVLGTIGNPGTSSAGIERSFVIGDQLWTMSAAGLRVSGLHSLQQQAWIAFS